MRHRTFIRIDVRTPATIDVARKPGNVAVARVCGLRPGTRTNHKDIANESDASRRDDARVAWRRRRSAPQRRVNAPKKFFAKRLESSPERDDSAAGDGRREDAGDVRRRCFATARDDRDRPSIARAGHRDASSATTLASLAHRRARVFADEKKGVPTHALRSITMRTSCAAQ